MSATGQLKVTSSTFTNVEDGKCYNVTIDDTGKLVIDAEITEPLSDLGASDTPTTLSSDATPGETLTELPRLAPGSTEPATP